MIVENSQNLARSEKNLNGLESKAKILDTCKKFEAIFLNQMLQMMKQNNNTEGIFAQSQSLEMFNSMLYSKISELMANSSQTGISSEIYQSITGKMPSNILLNEMSSPPRKIFTRIKNQVQKIPEKFESVKNESEIPPKNITEYEQRINMILKPYLEIINTSAEENKIKPNLIKAVILRESNGNPNAISHAGAKGLMQLMDGTARDLNVKNAFNPEENIKGGTKYLSKMFKIFKTDIDSSLAAYNAGPGNVQKYNGIPPFRETINYVKSVKNIFNKLEGNEVR